MQFLLKRGLSICKFNFIEDFVYQIIRIASDKCDLRFLMFSSNVVFEELVLRILRQGFAFVKSFLTPGA